MLLREVAAENESQVVLATHSEVLLDEALDRNLTLLLRGRADDLAARKDVRSALRHYGAAHYVPGRRARLRPVRRGPDGPRRPAGAGAAAGPSRGGGPGRAGQRVPRPGQSFRTPIWTRNSSGWRGGFGVTPRKHFFALRQMAPGLRGLAILDNDGGAHQGRGRRRAPRRLLEALRGRELRRHARRAPPRRRRALRGRAAVCGRSRGGGRGGARNVDPGTRLRRPRGGPRDLEGRPARRRRGCCGRRGPND